MRGCIPGCNRQHAIMAMGCCLVAVSRDMANWIPRLAIKKIYFTLGTCGRAQSCNSSNSSNSGFKAGQAQVRSLEKHPHCHCPPIFPPDTAPLLQSVTFHHIIKSLDTKQYLTGPTRAFAYSFCIYNITPRSKPPLPGPLRKSNNGVLVP